MYCLATMHSVTDGWTDWQTDDNMMSTGDQLCFTTDILIICPVACYTVMIWESKYKCTIDQELVWLYFHDSRNCWVLVYCISHRVSQK